MINHELNILFKAQYVHVGCWNSHSNAVSYPVWDLEGKDDRLDDTYYKPNPIQYVSKTRDNPIQTCYEVARDRGYNYFGVNNGGWCMGSYDAEFHYKIHGKRTNCKDGKGGQWSNDMYFIVQDPSK